MSERMKSLWRRAVNFHKDETGMEALQVVAILAVAAIVLAFIKNVAWPKIGNFLADKGSALTEE